MINKRLVMVATFAGLIGTSVVQADERQKIDQCLDVVAAGIIKIEDRTGEVQITGWDQNQMCVKGRLDEQATGYQFITDGDETLFEVELPKGHQKWWKSSKSKGSKLEISLPKQSEVWFDGVNVNVKVASILGGSAIETVNGNINARDLAGRIRLETVNGEVVADNLQGNIRLETVNGDVKDKGSSGKEIYYTTVNGDLNVITTIPEVVIDNVNGDINLELRDLEELKIETVNGDIDALLHLTSGGDVDISTVSGDADLRFAGEVSADFEIQVHAGGDIKNKLSSNAVKKAKYGPSKSLEMRLGKGSASVEVDTVSGDITLGSK